MANRTIQIIAAVILVACMAGAGSILPNLLDKSDRYALRYTDVSVEGAPPIVALGTMMGALRGVIVDYLWIKVNIAREQGLFYEIMHDTELITQLQPRFAAVWAFHGHNMAYNISVATHTEEERWEWVRRGIDLVRNKGIRYNPNDLNLYRELAFWFAHKIEGVADDAHLYYKREFAREWHYVLGDPPHAWEDRIEWMREIAEAPETLEEAERRTPGVKELVELLQSELSQYERRVRFRLDERLLEQYVQWEAIQGQSRYAEMLDVAAEMRRESPFFRQFDAIAGDPEYEEAWQTLLAHVRKRVLRNNYNMDPQLMYEYTRDLGPIDWRNANAHSLYWARKGSRSEMRLRTEEDMYRIINNDRHQIHAMQGLSRFGRINFDPFTNENPARFPEPRWIEAVNELFMELYDKFEVEHETRGAGPDTFMRFHQNFMADKVRELYRMGDREHAQRILDDLDELYRLTVRPPTNRFNQPLDVFVSEEVKGEYAYQPHIAPSEVAMSLRYGYIAAFLHGREEVLEEAIAFANEVTEYFKVNEYHNFVTKFGSARIGDIIGQLERSQREVFAQLMVDSSLPLVDRMTIWSQAPNSLRVQVYDPIRSQLAQQFQRSPLAGEYEFDEIFGEPAGIEQFRRMQAEQRRREQEREDRHAAPIERQ